MKKVRHGIESKVKRFRIIWKGQIWKYFIKESMSHTKMEWKLNMTENVNKYEKEEMESYLKLNTHVWIKLKCGTVNKGIQWQYWELRYDTEHFVQYIFQYFAFFNIL